MEKISLDKEKEQYEPQEWDEPAIPKHLIERAKRRSQYDGILGTVILVVIFGTFFSFIIYTIATCSCWDAEEKCVGESTQH